jgi:hypothetical protein
VSTIAQSKSFHHALFLLALLIASPSDAAELGMVRVAGTPEQIGTTWATINKGAIVQDVNATYLQRAAEAGISKETLLARGAEYVRIVQQIAPHWLEEFRATARTAGIDADLYLAFCGSSSRGCFLKADKADVPPRPAGQAGAIVECTSYAVPRDRAKDRAIFFHKTRDNTDRPQVGVIVESSLPGVHKFIGISDVGAIDGLSMMVNDQGLAAAADYPANLKKDSSTLVLPQAAPQYRGLSGGSIVRYIAERASSSAEALEILNDFVEKGYYAGGDVNGQHWLFVDREGVIIEACNNSRHLVSLVHTEEAYFSRFNKSEPVLRLRAADRVDFHMFHGLSREKPILTGQSISGMTVEIDPDRPDLLTVAWIALPARAAAIPLFMGQRRTPSPLADGTAYAAGKQTAAQGEKWESQKARWESLETELHAEKDALLQDVKESLDAGNPLDADLDRLETWSREKAAAILAEFERTK